MKFALFFRFFYSWYMIKYLLTDIGKTVCFVDSRHLMFLGSTKHIVSLGLSQ